MMDILRSTTHLHITTWVIGIILFFVTYSLYKKGSSKAKMMHMIARVFYILIFLTGGMLISNFAIYAQKMIVGLLVISFMELVLVRTKKGKSTGVVWNIIYFSILVCTLFRIKLTNGLPSFYVILTKKRTSLCLIRLLFYFYQYEIS